MFTPMTTIERIWGNSRQMQNITKFTASATFVSFYWPYNQGRPSPYATDAYCTLPPFSLLFSLSLRFLCP